MRNYIFRDPHLAALARAAERAKATMAVDFTLPENAKIVGSLKPAADAAGRNGRWINAGLAHKLYAVFHIDQGNAATIALTPQQATSVAGAGAKATTGNARIWANADLAANPDALTRQTDAVTFTTDAGVKEKVIVMEIDPATLDVAGGFFWVRFNTGASNAANITQCTVYAVPLRFAAAAPGVNIAQ